MGYWNELSFLERGMAAGAIDGATALETLMALNSQRQENRQARRAAAAEMQQGALESLVSTAQTAATEGTHFSQLKPLLDAIAAPAGLPTGGYRGIPGISGLFEGGYSKVNPGLDVEDETDISDLVFSTVNAGTGDRRDLGHVRQKVMAELAMRIPQEELSPLTPAIDEVITDAYSRAVRTPSTNYLDQFLGSTP